MQIAELLPSSATAREDVAERFRNEVMDYDTADAVSVPSDLEIAGEWSSSCLSCTRSTAQRS
mgnify:CR=1 FL=1